MAKTRTVTIHLEVETSVKLANLRDKLAWQARLDDYPLGGDVTIRQVTATVAQPSKKK